MYNVYVYVYYVYVCILKSSGAKRAYAPKQNKNRVFVGFCKQCTSPMLYNIFFHKTSYKADCGRFVISVLWQSGISDSDDFCRKTGYVAHARAGPRHQHLRLGYTSVPVYLQSNANS